MDLQLAAYKANKYGFSDAKPFEHPFGKKRAEVAMADTRPIQPVAQETPPQHGQETGGTRQASGSSGQSTKVRAEPNMDG